MGCCLIVDFVGIADLGHGGSGAVPKFRRGFLPRCRLLRPGVRRDATQLLQNHGQLAGRVPHSGQSTRPGKFPIRRHWKQDRFGEPSGESRGLLPPHHEIVSLIRWIAIRRVITGSVTEINGELYTRTEFVCDLGALYHGK